MVNECPFGYKYMHEGENWYIYIIYFGNNMEIYIYIYIYIYIGNNIYIYMMVRIFWGYLFEIWFE
jgi:hypothetical protein